MVRQSLLKKLEKKGCKVTATEGNGSKVITCPSQTFKPKRKMKVLLVNDGSLKNEE